MTFWQPSFDPMEELITQRQRINQLEQNQRSLIQAQNEIGSAMKDLVLQHNELVGALQNHKNQINLLKQQIELLKVQNDKML